MPKSFTRLAMLGCLLTLVVVMLGAYVRLSDAGLGCPDWPGCYGHIGVPSEDHLVDAANAQYPHRPVEAHKAWKEMVHRYCAGALGLVIAVLALWSTFIRRAGGKAPVGLAWALVAVVIFQAVLGMWTVTWQLKPLAVTAHLLGGMTTLSLLFLLVLRSRGAFAAVTTRTGRALRFLSAVALLAVVLQLFLGAWTSSNYAALACPDFPTCQTQWLPPLDYSEAYTLWRGIGINYEYGVLDNTPRVTIHFTHRIGAVVVLFLLLSLAIFLIVIESSRTLRGLGVLVLGLGAVQISLGVMTVLLHLPLPVAVAHNGGAALLVLALVATNYAAWRALPETRIQPLK